MKEDKDLMKLREEETLALHRQLAAEKLRADQGWERYEAKNRECLGLREKIAANDVQGERKAAVTVSLRQASGFGAWIECDPSHPDAVRFVSATSTPSPVSVTNGTTSQSGEADA